jgi:GH15 family glucan-1,4-alpha-glucosidase
MSEFPPIARVRTFTIFSRWLVSALAIEIERARALCKRVLSFAGPLLLHAEEIDADHRGAPRGTFPRPSPTWP